MVTQKPGSQSLQNFGNSDNTGQINSKILLLKSGVIGISRQGILEFQ